MPNILMPRHCIMKVTAVTNAGWNQRVVVDVPELRYDTIAGPRTQGAFSKSASGRGEHNNLILNMDEFYSDNDSEKAIIISLQHQRNNSGAWVQSSIRAERVNDSKWIVKAEDGVDSDYNDTLVTITSSPYFS